MLLQISQFAPQDGIVDCCKALFGKWPRRSFRLLYYINVRLASLTNQEPLLKSGLFEDGVGRLEKMPEGGDG